MIKNKTTRDFARENNKSFYTLPRNRSTRDFARENNKSFYTLPRNRSAAMEMSFGTIVTIVLLVTVLIMGLVFIRNIMCSGIQLTDKITEKMKNEVAGLFGSDEYGVKCLGEGGQEVKLGDGGRRQIFCTIATDTASTYDLVVTSVTSITPATDNAEVQKWIVDKDAKGVKVLAGTTTVTVLVLNVPKQVSDTTLKIITEEKVDGGSPQTHTSYIDLKHVGAVTSTVC